MYVITTYVLLQFYILSLSLHLWQPFMVTVANLQQDRMYQFVFTNFRQWIGTE